MTMARPDSRGIRAGFAREQRGALSAGPTAACIGGQYTDWLLSAVCAAKLSLCYTSYQAEEGYGRLARRSGSDHRALPCQIALAHRQRVSS